MEAIRVLVADNEEIFREGLAKLLKEQLHIEVVYQCGSSKEAVEKSKEMKPDIVLMDSQISEGKALEAVREINQLLPEVKVVMITHPETQASPIEILKAGARACLTKTISAPDLVKSIELVSSGRIIISPVLAERFLYEIGSRKTDDRRIGTKSESDLSGREIEITKLIAEGATNKEIAESLFIAESTVKVHVKNILDKLELRNRQQVAVYAVLRNWVAANTETERKDLASGT